MKLSPLSYAIPIARYRMALKHVSIHSSWPQKHLSQQHAVALHFMYYNFGRIHKSLRITPAMAAGVSDHVWSLEEIASLAS